MSCATAVLVDLARKVWEGTTIDLGMGSFNVIWQADANAMALQSLEQSGQPGVRTECRRTGTAQRSPGLPAVCAVDEQERAV